MKTPLPSQDEKQRLEVLRQYEVLDTPPEEAFDDLTMLAAQICTAPIALISLVDEKRQWFKSKPGLILLDIQLPLMNGYAVAQALRQNPALREVPIVAVTSYAMVGDRERVMAAGGTGYIEKPITFANEIEQYLKARPPGGGDLP
jgi:CheY-like chemotaxis protein